MTGLAGLLGVCLLVILFGWPTRRRLARVVAPKRGPHPLLRPVLALRERLRRFGRRRRRRRLRKV